MKRVLYLTAMITEGYGKTRKYKLSWFKCLDFLFGNNDHKIGLVWIILGVDKTFSSGFAQSL